MRKVKDAKDFSSGELIYFKGHAKATYMSDGTTVEDAINNIEAGSEVDLSDYATKEELNGKQDKLVSGTNIKTINGTSILGGGDIVISGGGDLSDYATKEELNGKQDTIADLEVIRQGAAKGATALQSYTEQYKGTVTGVKINGTTKNPSSGIVDLGTVITSHQDISGKQDKLVSGTNIKTINGTSILGSGNIIISGSGEGSTGSAAYPLITVLGTGIPDIINYQISPNTFYVMGGQDLEVSSLSITLGDEIASVANEYLFQFLSGSEPTTLILPDSIKFNSDFTVEPNKKYQISILNGLGTVMSWDNLIN